jgi:hypothetical protein
VHLLGCREKENDRTMTFKWIFKSICVLTFFLITLTIADVMVNHRPASELLSRRVAALRRLFHQLAGAPEPPSGIAISDKKSVVFRIRGLTQPAMTPARRVRASDETPVIGVSVGTEFRAYLPEAMSIPPTHIINDLIGNTAVTVTYCDRTDCARVLTQANRSTLLDVGGRGLSDGQMTIDIDGQVFVQDSPDVPLDDISFSRTTWGQWKVDHPESDVYVGAFSRHVPPDPAD